MYKRQDISFDGGKNGVVTVQDIGHTGGTDNTEINAVTLIGATISTNGKINTVSNSTTDRGTVTITGAMRVDANTTIETDTASSTGGSHLDGNIDINGTINASGSETLTLQSGSGSIDVSGLIGGTDGLGTVAINTTTGSGNEATGTIALAGLGSADGSSESGTDNGSTFTAGNTNTASISLDGDMYFTGGNTLFEAASGNTIDNDQSTTAVTDFITSGDSIEFKGGTLYLQDATTGVSIATSGGAVTINSLDGDHDETVTIDAGAGAVTVGRIGGSNALTSPNNVEGIKSVAITSSHATGITLSGNITTSNTGSNSVTLTGPVVIDGDVDIDTNTATNDGTLEFTSTIKGANGSSDDFCLLYTSPSPRD
mgnify:CR=1 FL=1